MSAAIDSQTLDQQQLTALEEYQFTGHTDTVEKKRRFIIALQQEASVYHAAIFAGVGRKTVYRWAENDAEFAEAWNDALENAADVAEHSTYHRAINGDSLLLMFWLKRYRPQFRDKVTIDIAAVDNEIKERLAQMEATRPTPPVSTPFQSQPGNQQKEPLQLPAPTPTSE